ncbi:MAG: hypothetical protein R2719_14985 [Micropruina sp.]
MRRPVRAVLATGARQPGTADGCRAYEKLLGMGKIEIAAFG